jgi:CelD/BcsL family acetyltransferase involved in cellulose biosynthesis
MTSHRDAPRDAPAFRVRTLTNVAQMQEVADGWHELWSRCEGARTPYLSYEWVRTWAEHYVPDGGLHVLVVEHDGRVAGIMPLMRHRYGGGPFSVFALETVGRESRNLIALVDPRLTETVIDALAQHLRDRIGAQGAVLHLTLVPSENPVLQELVSRLASKRPAIAVRRFKSSAAPYVPLPTACGEFERSLGRRRRKVLASAGKRLAQAHHDVRIRWVHFDEIADAMEKLFGLHETRWNKAGMRGLFHDARSRSFHVAIARECDRLGWLGLSVIEIDGRAVSVHFVVVLDGVAYMMSRVPRSGVGGD